MRKILWALALGLGSGALFFVVITLVASLLPTVKNDSFIIGTAAALLGLFVAFSIMFRK